MRCIAIINQKGGVGKTTTSVNLGAALVEAGRRVVLVDMDPQANLSLSLDVELRGEQPSVYSVLLGRHAFEEALYPTATPGLQVCPSHIDLSGAELELASQIGREALLGDALESWTEAHRSNYGEPPADYVLFDCPPSLGLLAVNALACAGEVLIVVQTEFLALQGMSKLVEIVSLLRRRLNPGLEITGILPALYDSRLRLAREVLAEVRKYFPGQVLQYPIRTNVKLAEAPSFGQHILQYAPDSNGALDYRRAAREIMTREHLDSDLAHLPGPPPIGEQLRVSDDSSVDNPVDNRAWEAPLGGAPGNPPGPYQDPKVTPGDPGTGFQATSQPPVDNSPGHPVQTVENPPDSAAPERDHAAQDHPDHQDHEVLQPQPKPVPAPEAKPAPSAPANPVRPHRRVLRADELPPLPREVFGRPAGDSTP